MIVAAILLGAGYGSCQVCGFAEVYRVASPDDLAGLTAVYQAVSYIGFALPFLLATAARAVCGDICPLGCADHVGEPPTPSGERAVRERAEHLAHAGRVLR